MGERIHKEIKSTSGREAVEEVVEIEPVTDGAEKLKSELDDLLDEIDEVLETNAEEFVKSYVQKGGQ